MWEGRFKNVLVESDEQLLHLSRYIHLNPTTSFLVDKPEDWQGSSYREYLDLVDKESRVCRPDAIFELCPKEYYKKFVEDRIGYQRELANIKKLLLDDEDPQYTS